MTFNQQLQHALETITERVRGETVRALATLTDELASAVEAERAAAATLAAAEARAAAEQEASARLVDAIAAAEQVAGLRLASAEREADARLVDALAAAEQRAGVRLADAVAAAEREAGARNVDALAAAEQRTGVRLADAVAAAEQEAGTLLAAAVAAAEQEAGTRLAAAVAAAEAQGREAGLETGRNEGREEGRQQGREKGRQEGLEEGRREGWESGRLEGFARGHEQGREEGRQESVAAQEIVAERHEQTLAQKQQDGREDARADLRATELAANERLVHAIRALDRARSLSEILDTLASCAGREAKRVGILLVRHGQLRGWRFIGFGPGLDERTDCELRSGDAGIIADAARTGLAASADSATPLSTPAFAELPPGREVLAVPVPMSGEVVAVLYADQGPAEVSDAELRVAWPSTLEVMARHAARCLEAVTAFRAAQVLTERPDAALSGSLVDSRVGESAKITAPGEKEDADQAAKRYARLLVSEIKLYHEAAVLAGRRERDLMTRLGGEITRARALYEQRVPADARRGTDHFHSELVRTLANGDAGLLEAKG
jgi:flagellar biosynthesis/type III secretory pathway protein FliH